LRAQYFYYQAKSHIVITKINYYVLQGDLQEMKDFKNVFHNDIIELGVPDGLLGEKYCYVALSMLDEDPFLLCCMCKGLYNGIAERVGTNPACVERNMRTFVRKVWTADNHIYLNKMANRTLKKKPTNRDFLDLLFLYWSDREDELRWEEVFPELAE